MWQFVLKFAYGHLWKHPSHNYLTRNYAFNFVWISFGDVFFNGPRFCVWRRYVCVRGEIASMFFFFFNVLLRLYSCLYEKPHTVFRYFFVSWSTTLDFFSWIIIASYHIKSPLKRFAFFIYVIEFMIFKKIVLFFIIIFYTVAQIQFYYPFSFSVENRICQDITGALSKWTGNKLKNITSGRNSISAAPSFAPFDITL